MDPAVVALLAAGIPATVAAGTFVTTQILSVVLSGKRRRLEGLVGLLDVLEEVPNRLTQPRGVGVVVAPELSVLYKATRLVAVLPKRELILWEWLAVRVPELARVQPMERVELAGEISAVVITFIRDPRKARDLLGKLRSRGKWQPLIERLPS